ncbi:MAG: hypothetical protein JO255_20035 [Alphaproteobacteria bacterium]|nr:hypothetical protein [Alphaproteobacteria bacterium]
MIRLRYRTALAVGLLAGGLLWSAAALACPDLAAAPSTRWTLRAEGGREWLVTPCGERFYSTGINVLDGDIPKQPMPGHVGYEWQRYYPSLEAWRDDTRRRIAAWGFNSAGAWSLPPDFLKLPSIPNLELGRLARFHWFDPFDPATEAAMRELAPQLVAAYKGSPYRIGYFSDNEVGWWSGALFVFYSTKPASNHTKQRWVEILRDQYGDDWQRFVADFVPPDGVSSWDDLLRTEQPTKLRPGGQGIQAVRRWTGAVAEQYYAMIERVLRAADPDALIFGDRLPIYYDPIAVRAMARHVDVIAMNYNIDSPDGWVARYFFDGLRQLSGGKPILISEWFFAANENRSGNHNNGHLMTVQTQAERARGAAAAALNLASVPEIVGTHWFQFADHPKGGRQDGEDYDFGLVDIENQPYQHLIAALSQANRALPGLHAAAQAEPVAASHEFTIPRARINLAERSLRAWPKPASLLPPLTPAAGEVAFGEAYLAWSDAGISLATIGQDYYDLDLLAYDGEFPLGEAYRLQIGLDAGAGPRRFTLYFIPPRTKVKDHPPMTALLCAGEAALPSDCTPVAGGNSVYFGADQPRITAEAFLPWSALGVERPPLGHRVKVEVAATAWHRSRWMSLSGLPPEEGMVEPGRWTTARLGGVAPEAPTHKTHPGF